MYGLYHPLGLWTATLDGHVPVTALDQTLPLWPVWLYPYTWVFFVGFLPLCVVRHMPLFRRVALSYVLVQLVALSCFVAVPVHMVHGPGALPVDSFLTWAIALMLWVDTSANCFPSLHVAGSVLAALATHRVDRTLGRIAWVLAVLISASTLLVKQHYAVDVVAGAALSWGAYRLVVAPVSLDGVPRAEWTLDRRWSAIPLVLWAVGLAVLVGLYANGWVPPPDAH